MNSQRSLMFLFDEEAAQSDIFLSIAISCLGEML